LAGLSARAAAGRRVEADMLSSSDVVTCYVKDTRAVTEGEPPPGGAGIVALIHDARLFTSGFSPPAQCVQ
jgi:hypothetical protein